MSSFFKPASSSARFSAREASVYESYAGLALADGLAAGAAVVGAVVGLAHADDGHACPSAAPSRVRSKLTAIAASSLRSLRVRARATSISASLMPSSSP